MEYFTDEYEEIESTECDDKEIVNVDSWKNLYVISEVVEKSIEESDHSSDSLIKSQSDITLKLKKLFEDRKYLKLKNNYLHKKSCNTLMKTKHISRVERTTIYCLSIHSDRRYEQVLDEFNAIKIHLNETSECRSQSLEHNRDLFDIRLVEFTNINENFLLKLIDVGVECFSTKKHTILSTKNHIIELINKQKHRLDILTNVRVQYFKLLNSYNDIQNAIKNVTQLTKGYSLINYENLEMIRSVRINGLEKNEKKLKTIGNKCHSIVNSLAHIRQALSVIADDIQVADERLSDADKIKSEEQKELFNLKKLKDCKRKEIDKLQRENVYYNWKSVVTNMMHRMKQKY